MAAVSVSAPAEKRVEDLPPYLSVNRTLEVAGFGRNTLYLRLREGCFRAVKHGGRTLIDTASLLAWQNNLPEAKFAPPVQRKRG